MSAILKLIKFVVEKLLVLPGKLLDGDAGSKIGNIAAVLDNSIKAIISTFETALKLL